MKITKYVVMFMLFSLVSSQLMAYDYSTGIVTGIVVGSNSKNSESSESDIPDLIYEVYGNKVCIDKMNSSIFDSCNYVPLEGFKCPRGMKGKVHWDGSRADKVLCFE